MSQNRLQFVIPIKPIAWRVGIGGRRLYIPPVVKQYERDVGWYASIAMKKAGFKSPFFGAINLMMKFHLPIPKTRRYRQKRDKTWTGLQPGDEHLQDPDLRNLSKSTEDGMKRIVYADDCQVWKDGDEKVWSEVGSVGFIEVEVEAI